MPKKGNKKRKSQGVSSTGPNQAQAPESSSETAAAEAQSPTEAVIESSLNRTPTLGSSRTPQKVESKVPTAFVPPPRRETSYEAAPNAWQTSKLVQSSQAAWPMLGQRPTPTGHDRKPRFSSSSSSSSVQSPSPNVGTVPLQQETSSSPTVKETQGESGSFVTPPDALATGKSQKTQSPNVWKARKGSGPLNPLTSTQTCHSSTAEQPQQKTPSPTAWQGKGITSPLKSPQSPTSLQITPQKPAAYARQVSDLESVTEALSEATLQEKLQTTPNKPTVAKKAPTPLHPITPRKDAYKAGSLGKKIQVYTNMMKIVFEPNFKSNVIHYDVDIDPDKPKYLKRNIFDKAKNLLFPNRHPAFDGKKNLYSAGPLPIDDPKTVEIRVLNEEGNEREFKITFKKAAELDLSWLPHVAPGLKQTEWNQSCMQALDIIMRMAPLLKATPVGRSFYNLRVGDTNKLGGGMDLWTGHFQSTILGWKPFLNIDVAHKGFPTPQPVTEFVKLKLWEASAAQQNRGGGGQNQNRGGGQYQNRGRGGGRGGSQQQYGGRGGGQQHHRGRGGGGQQQYGLRGGGQQMYDERNTGGITFTPYSNVVLPEVLPKPLQDEIIAYLSGLKIHYAIPNHPGSQRIYRVNGCAKNAEENKFEHNDTVCTVSEYYRTVKAYQIQYSKWPCLWVGNKTKQIHVPMELCKIIPGQATLKKLNEAQTSSMIRHAATGTEERKQKIMDAFNKIDFNHDPCMKEFGISVDGQFIKVDARILDPPNLTYKNNKYVSVSKGTWRPELFQNPSTLIANDKSWSILYMCRRNETETMEFVDRLRSGGARLGMKIGIPHPTIMDVDGRQKHSSLINLQTYFTDCKKNNVNLIVVVIPDTKGPYSWVKKMSELNVGILTQCLKNKTIFKVRTEASQSTTTNILLKINAKLNGINHAIAPDASLPYCFRNACMIVGADVTHPSPDAKDTPSIAAVVASHDKKAFLYNTEIRLQAPKQEIIGDLADIMTRQLMYFFNQTTEWPQRIIFYRDGVSEGQFQQVMGEELMAIRKACTTIEKKIGQRYKPPITFLVVQKRHHTRLFPTSDRDSDDKNHNVKAGTVVDTEITHPTDIDFYLVSHASIQGTARPTKYRCLWDDANMSEDEIEQLTYYLCHMYARCTRSVSYPTPTYYAHLAAFRARALTYEVAIDMKNLPNEQLQKLTLKQDLLKKNPMFFV